MIHWLQAHGLWPFHVAWSQWSGQLFAGLLRTLEFTAVGFTVAAALGLVLALMRTSRLRLFRLPAAVYTELFKNIPLLVIVFVLYFGLPETKGVFGDWVVLGSFPSGAAGLAIFYAAYLSETFRSALSGIHDGQREAAQALGLGRWSIFAIEDFTGLDEGYTWQQLYMAMHGNISLTPIAGPHDIMNRYFTEDAPYGLVPWSHIGRAVGVPTPVIDSVVNLYNVLHEKDWWADGRGADDLGLAGLSAEQIMMYVKTGAP